MIVYLFDGSLEGLFCAVFDSYTYKEIPDSIIEERYLQLGFDQKIRIVDTDPAKAARVSEGLRKQAGHEVYNRAWTAFLSMEIDKVYLLRYIRAAFTYQKKVFDMIAHEDVNPVFKLCTYINNEAHHYKGFVRFSLLENGVYFSRIKPKNQVIPLIMPHFADRYRDQPFLIYDQTHHLAGVYPLSQWYMVDAADLQIPQDSEDEAEWKALWKQFYDTIAIKERKNSKQRRTMCPKRFWGEMHEMRGEV